MPCEPSLSEASAISVRSRDAAAVDGGHELDRHAAVVAHLVEHRHELVPVERALAAAACGCCRPRGRPRACRRRCAAPAAQSASSMFMWKMSRRHAAVAAHVLGQRQRLVGAVEEVGLEAVERLEADPHAHLLGVRLALLQRLDGPVPLVLGRAHRHDLADGGGDDRDDLAAPVGDLADRVLHVVDRAAAHVGVLVQQVAPAGHQRHRAPAAARPCSSIRPFTSSVSQTDGSPEISIAS